MVNQKKEYAKIDKIKSAIKDIDWTHYREEDFDVG